MTVLPATCTVHRLRSGCLGMTLSLLLCGSNVFAQAAASDGPRTVSLSAAQSREIRIPEEGPVISRPITSMKALRARGVTLQQTDYSCGAAAVATILKEHFKRDVDEMQVIRGMLQFADPEVVKATGFSLLDMRKYVESIGLRGSGFKVGPQRLFELKVPVISLIDLKGYKHFVVIKKASEGRVYVADPSFGNRTFRIEEFVEMWNGVLLAITGPGADPNSVLTKVDAPALQHRADAAYIEVRRAALDFGFRSFDLF